MSCDVPQPHPAVHGRTGRDSFKVRPISAIRGSSSRVLLAQSNPSPKIREIRPIRAQNGPDIPNLILGVPHKSGESQKNIAARFVYQTGLWRFILRIAAACPLFWTGLCLQV